MLIFTVSGLSRKKDYNIYVRAVSNDQKRYKYLNNKWAPASDSDVAHDRSKMIAKHPNSPQSGAKWMMRDVDFKSVKITHYTKSKHGDVSLCYNLYTVVSIRLQVYIHITCSCSYTLLDNQFHNFFSSADLFEHFS